MKILCVFVRHGTAKYPEALDVLNRWYARHGLLEQRILWVVDNALAADARPTPLAPATVLRPGDNRAWEFSAWDRALREARAERVDPDVVHLVTSAFNTLYTGYLDHFHREMLPAVAARRLCLGHIDSHPVALQLGNAKSSSWVRTCFFFLPWAVARTLAPWFYYQNPTPFFSAPDSRSFRPDAPLGASYQAHLTAWLEGREIGGHQWHSPVRHGPEENRRFQLKALAILNEHRLAVTLRAGGVRLTDFCWLHSLGNLLPAGPPEPPVEEVQLQVRRRILGIPEEPG